MPVPAGSRSQPTTARRRSHPCGHPQQTGNELFFFLCSENRIEKSVQQIFPERLYLFLVCPLAIIAGRVVVQSSRPPGWSRFGSNPLGTRGELQPWVHVGPCGQGERGAVGEAQTCPPAVVLPEEREEGSSLPIDPVSIQEGTVGMAFRLFCGCLFPIIHGSSLQSKIPPDSCGVSCKAAAILGHDLNPHTCGTVSGHAQVKPFPISCPVPSPLGGAIRIQS